MQLATTLWSKSATFHVQLGVLSCTVNRACVSASLGRSVHVVVSLHKSTTDTYLWGRPDSGCLTRVRYRHLTRPSSSCEGRLRQTTSSPGLVLLRHNTSSMNFARAWQRIGGQRSTPTPTLALKGKAWKSLRRY